ncbi:MAG: hypothetical protein AB1635_09915 [Acidobacteriota bacterium]
MYAFTKSLRNADHSRRYSITRTDAGWDVLEEADSRVVRRSTYTDWRRVEWARRSFTLAVSDLREQGWSEEN